MITSGITNRSMKRSKKWKHHYSKTILYYGRILFIHDIWEVGFNKLVFLLTYLSPPTAQILPDFKEKPISRLVQHNTQHILAFGYILAFVLCIEDEMWSMPYFLELKSISHETSCLGCIHAQWQILNNRGIPW